MRASLRVRRDSFELALDLEVEPGRVLALLGPNGAGKSTALAAIAGLVDSAGSIVVGGRVLDDVPTEQRRVGFVFQDHLLFPHLSVLDNVAFGATREIASEWLARFDLVELAKARPLSLSGGQSQRVALARALATDPDVLLLDEPLAALDVSSRDAVRGELARHLRDLEIPTIVVTHDFEDVVALADDVIVIENGVATQRATVRELVQYPATPYVQRLVRDWSEDER